MSKVCHRSVKYTLEVEGMKCEGCVKRIENILEKEKGVLSYEVSLEKKRVEILLKKNSNIQNIINKIEVLDFKVKIIN